MNPRSPSPPSKRQKVFRACSQCVSAKTRCDDVQPSGCLLCRKKNKACSLNDLSVLSQSQSDGKVEMLEKRCRDLEHRVRYLEDSLHSQHTRQEPLHQPIPPATFPTLPHAIDNPLIDLQNTGLMVLFDESLFSASSPKGYPCVVARGLLTRDEVDMGFQVFKHRFTRILPLAPFLLASTPTPTNPFLILAMLHHVPALTRSEFPHLLDESLLYCLTGAVNSDVVMALLILSLAPEPVHSTHRPHPTSLRMISLANEVGLAIGLDGVFEDQIDLDEPWNAQLLEKVQLWSAVVNRYNILHLIQAQIRNIVPPLRRTSNSPTDIHLQAEIELVNIALPFIDFISKAEPTTMTKVPDVPHLISIWDETKRRFDSFHLGKPPSILHDARCLQFGMSCRLSSYIQRIPSPLGPTRQDILPSMGYLPSYTMTIVRLINEDTLALSVLPRYVVYMFTFTLVYARRIYSFMMKRYNSAYLIELPEVEAAERKVHEFGGTPGMILAHAAAGLAAEDHQHQSDFSLDLPEGFSMFDLVRWDFGLDVDGGTHMGP